MKTLPEINCDLGEGVAGEDKVFPWIDAASVACGGHCGDKTSIQATLTHCLIHGTKAGAHPSYPDTVNFGRVSVQLTPADLTSSILNQIRNFEAAADQLAITMDHIKFHGALYNDCSADPLLADYLTDFLASHYPRIPLFVPPNSYTEKYAVAKGLPVKREIFGDRRYSDAGHLLPRHIPGAVITSTEEVLEHLAPAFERADRVSFSGSKLPLPMDTICFHGDNPGLMDFLPLIRKKWWT